MEKYMPKAAVLAEIERRIKTNKECMLGLRNLDYYQGKVDALNDTISFLDTIELKEVDLEKEINKYIADWEDLPELEREVVVLVDNFGKLIPKLAKRTYHLIENFVDEDTGEIISIEKTNEVGDVINWTEPAIYWLDINLPKLEED